MSESTDHSSSINSKHVYKPENRPKRSDSIAKISEALAKAQGQIENVEKDRKGTYGSYGTLAATWVAIRKALSENSIFVYQRPLTIDGKPFMCTMLSHSSGEFFDDSEMEMKVENNNRMNAMQALGSAVTYARRYTLQAATGVAPEDDDGIASGEVGKNHSNQNENRQHNNNQSQRDNQNKRPNQQPQPKPQSPPLASPELLGELSELMYARGVSESDMKYLAGNGYNFKGTQLPEAMVRDMLALLSDTSVNSAAIKDLADNMANDRNKPKDETNADEKDSAFYIMPIGDEGVKGQPLSKLSESTLKKILEWTGGELKKVPPVKNLSQVFEIQTNVKSFLASVGVE